MNLYPNVGPAGSPDADTAVSNWVGRVLRDRYVIEGRLESGGVSAVFKALDRYRSSFPKAQQYVALKVFCCGNDDYSEQAIKDFHHELQCGQALSHQNIVNVFELDRDGDVLFFTMELLDGELLSDLIERMRPAALQPSQAWQLIRQLGAGLAHAHERGIVHGELKPRNLLITRSGELRILGFGAARTFTCPQPNPHRRGIAPISGTAAYASCELLEGRTADPRDDLYALACICYELLAGAHPFAGRPATLARDFGVKAARPAGLTSRQWRTLQNGLSWHRGARSINVHTWIQRLTYDLAQEPPTTPLAEFRAASVSKPNVQLRAAASIFAVFLIAGACIAQLSGPQKARDGTISAAQHPMEIQPPTALTSKELTPPDTLSFDSRVAGATNAVDGMVQAKLSVRPPPAMISVDGYHVSYGDRFVEVRVHRNQLQNNSSFSWWTEPATAREDIDYVHQGNAIQTFPAERRTTRFYVKLLPSSGRSQRDYFYVAIAQPGRDRSSERVTRVPIWLPIPRDQLQAQR